VATIKPFRALRPRPDVTQRVASPPYDVLTSDEARRLAADNPLSFLRVNKPEITLPEGCPTHAPEVYARARENLRTLVDQGVMIRDERPGIYLYAQQMGDHVQAGFVALASLDEYDSNRIRKHEHTRPDKVEDRARLIDAMDSQVGPVFLAFRSRPELTELTRQIQRNEPIFDFVADDGIGHRGWILEEGIEKAVVHVFSGVDLLYVADGHHRSAAASRVRELRRSANPQHTGQESYNFFLTVIFPDDQLRILDYNRLVRDLAGLTPDRFLDRVAERFEISSADNPRPPRPHTFGMHLEGRWHRLAALPGSFPADDPVRRLDVSILQENLLAPVLGIGDPRTDPRIDFVGGARGLDELERRCRSGWAVAFAMFPTALEDLFGVADAGQVMPPKSTWFEPKLRSGLFVSALGD
jgi:uncharacterized protein (DUF1015 family)